MANPSASVAASSLSRLGRWLRRDILIIVWTLIILAATIALLDQVDRSYYGKEKNELVLRLIEEKRLLADGSRESLLALLDIYARAFASVTGDDARSIEFRSFWKSDTEARLREVLARNPEVWKLSLQDAEGYFSVEVVDRNRFDTQNQWSNSLFHRDWSRSFATVRREGDRSEGAVTFHVTSPLGVPEVEALTRLWRRRAIELAVALWGVWALLLIGVLIPSRRVLGALDRDAARAAPFLRRPVTMLEQGYNRLARDANLAAFSRSMRQLVETAPMADVPALLEAIPRLVATHFGIRRAAVCVLRRQPDSDAWRLDGHWPAEAHDPAIVVAREHLHRHPPHRDLPAWRGAIAEDYTPRDVRAPWFVDTIVEGDGESTVVLLSTGGAMTPWWRELFADIARELAFAVGAVNEQQRRLSAQSSRGNISLARNLGHDLTNIIATAKLDLMALQSILKLPPEQIAASPGRMAVMHESVEALLKATRFQQEIVNIYRSFSYLSRPAPQPIALGDVVTHIATLYSEMLGARIPIRVEVEAGLGPVVADPRLLRLAVFNLVSNALDSVRRGASDASTTPAVAAEVLLQARAGRRPGTQEIIIADTGPGIRHRDGRLMEPNEIETIFRLGYTTKADGGGEGLGLDWVRQIVREFHNGRVEAANRAPRGAEFRIVLPTHEGTP